jgi:hypothetical protein
MDNINIITPSGSFPKIFKCAKNCDSDLSCCDIKKPRGYEKPKHEIKITDII